jgi:hypothetical protein
MTRKHLLTILFGAVFAAVFMFIGLLTVPHGPLTTARLTQMR